MPKGVPWTIQEELQLTALVKANTPIAEIAAKLGRQPAAILMKCQRLGLEIDRDSEAFPMPEELPSVEEALKKLAGALEAASAPGLSRAEMQRLQLVANLAKSYKEILADYLDYRGIESKLAEMEAKYAALLASKNNAPQPAPATVAKTPEQ